LWRDRQVWGQVRADEIDAHVGDPDGTPGAEHRENEALGEQLPHDPAAARAEGGPERHLPLATGAPGDQQAGHVCACDQQDERRRRLEKCEEGRGEAGLQLVQRNEQEDRPAFVSGY
jgi:hypothetical protein